MFCILLVIIYDASVAPCSLLNSESICSLAQHMFSYPKWRHGQTTDTDHPNSVYINISQTLNACCESNLAGFFRMLRHRIGEKITLLNVRGDVISYFIMTPTMSGMTPPPLKSQLSSAAVRAGTASVRQCF